MSRKRFIKLLMSHGVSRNEAVQLANHYNRYNIPYKIAYQRYKIPIVIRLASMRMMAAIRACFTGRW